MESLAGAQELHSKPEKEVVVRPFRPWRPYQKVYSVSGNTTSICWSYFEEWFKFGEDVCGYRLVWGQRVVVNHLGKDCTGWTGEHHATLNGADSERGPELWGEWRAVCVGPEDFGVNPLLPITSLVPLCKSHSLLNELHNI